MNLKKLNILIMLLMLAVVSSCERPTEPPNQNLPPETTIANVPAEKDTLFPLVTISWNGGDNDGYVAKYQYRYITYFETQHDSLVHDWVETEKTSVTLTLSSSDLLNRQRFQVRAVDNMGAADPTPAEKIFFTPRAMAPETKIFYPADKQEFFVLDKTTDWWRGIQLTFNAKDKDGQVVEYAWSVDGGQWHWTSDTSLYIGPSSFGLPLEGKHEISVMSKDNTNLTDLTAQKVTVNFVKPAFKKTLLILDETNESNWPNGVSASDDSVDNYYSELFGLMDKSQWDTWDYKKNGGAPSREVLGQYKLLLWHGDDRPTTKAHMLAANEDLIKDYATVGGDFIISGWRMIKSFAWQDPFPKKIDKENFVNKYLHIAAADETPLGSDFTKGIGVGGFPNVRVDQNKLGKVFPFFGSLAQVNIISERGGFTDIILSYGTSDNSKFPQYRGLPCGIIYYGTSFKAVVLGFPLFFMEKEDAKLLARQILKSMNYL